MAIKGVAFKPEDKIALAQLYVLSQGVDGLTLEELAEKYAEAVKAVRKLKLGAGEEQLIG